MQFSWATFFIEIVNFLILVWILKRLLYVPIKKAIKLRQQSIQESLDKATKLKHEAEYLKTRYENRLNDWGKEKEEQKKELHQEMIELKKEEFVKLHEALDKEKEKVETISKLHLKKQMEMNLQESMRLATNFSTKFLKIFADIELEKKIIETFVENLSQIPEEQYQSIKSEIDNAPIIKIQSAFPLNDKQKSYITDIFQKRFGNNAICNFNQRPDLLSGLNVQIGSIVLQANLRDELKFFSEVAHGSI